MDFLSITTLFAKKTNMCYEFPYKHLQKSLKLMWFPRRCKFMLQLGQNIFELLFAFKASEDSF